MASMLLHLSVVALFVACSAIPDNFDYIVIGAGSGGATVASKLVTQLPDAAVLVLESGPPDDQPSFTKALIGLTKTINFIDWINPLKFPYKFDDVSPASDQFTGRAISDVAGNCYGGGNTINLNIVSPGHAEQYDIIARATGDPSWSNAGMHRYYTEYNTRFPKVFGPVDPVLEDVFAQFGVPKAADPFTGGNTGYIQHVYQWYNGTSGGDPVRETAFNRLLRPLLTTAPNLFILPRRRVDRVLFAGNRAVGVEGKDLSGLLSPFFAPSFKFSVRREVIIAAGAKRTPQVLMLSGIGPADELARFSIPPVQVLSGVGKNFRNHPGLINDGLGFLLQNFYSNPVYMVYGPNTAGPPKCQVYIWKGGFIIYLLDVQGTGQVTLKSRDGGTAPAFDPGLLLEPRDLATLVDVVHGFALPVMEELKARGYPILTLNALLGQSRGAVEALVKGSYNTFWHPSGTAKMGPAGDPLAVVDAGFRVHGVRGVRVVDQSVFPMIPYGNTNVPTIMAAMKAGDTIVQDAAAGG